MIKLQRLGVVLEPAQKAVRTVAKFNAGMTLDGDTVHMAFRYAEWRPGFDERSQSNYAIDEIRYARLTPSGKLVYEARQPLVSPSLSWDAAGCQDPRVISFEGAFYLVYCGWDKGFVPAGQDRARMGIARTDDFVTSEKLGVVGHYTWDKDAFLFPERIHGKVAFVHRVSPNIQIDYFDSIEVNPRSTGLGGLPVPGGGLDRAASGVSLGMRQSGRECAPDQDPPGLAVHLPRGGSLPRRCGETFRLPGRGGAARPG